MTARVYEIRRQPLVGTHYVRHALYVDGVEVHSQISPYSEDEIESRVAAHLRNDPLPPRTDAKRAELVAKGSIGGRKKQRKVTAQGFRWEQESET